jgi:hypothetical protein
MQLITADTNQMTAMTPTHIEVGTRPNAKRPSNHQSDGGASQYIVELRIKYITI